MVDRGATEASKHGLTRSSEWEHVEKAHKLKEPKCICCGSILIQVHHIFPFHYCILLGRPDLELDDRNLVSLCEDQHSLIAQDHHLLLGHLDNFKSYNLNVRADCIMFSGMTAWSIKGDSRWIQKKKNSPKLIQDMTDEDKTVFVALMESTYGPRA